MSGEHFSDQGDPPSREERQTRRAIENLSKAPGSGTGCGYLPWCEAPITGNICCIRECFHFYDGNGYCENPLSGSPYTGKSCPWQGNPEKEKAGL